MSQPFDDPVISCGSFFLLQARTSVKSSCSSGRNNKSRLFLLSAALRVSPRADERALEISSERKKVQSVLVKGK